MSADLEFRQRLPLLRLAENTAEIQIEDTHVSNGGEECRTPTSPQHRIPAVLKCPPAPMKPRKAVSCKRKLSELQFFEIVAGEEIDSFFRVSFEMVRAKRRFPCA